MKTKIMVVDDDPNIRELVRLYLEKEGLKSPAPSAATRP